VPYLKQKNSGIGLEKRASRRHRGEKKFLDKERERLMVILYSVAAKGR